MDIRKRPLVRHAIAAFIMVAVMAFTSLAGAVSIGDVVLQSRPGEPLLARVELMVGSNERIEDTCLSLVSPDSLQKDSGSYLTEANLSIRIEGMRQYVDISSLRPFNVAFARLRLQVKCPGSRGIIKTLTISSTAQSADKKQNRSASFAPGFPGEMIDESSIGNVSVEDIAKLLAQQKLLLASALATQQQLKLLQDELAEIKSKLAQSGANASAVALVPSATHLPSTGAQGDSLNQNVAEIQPVMRQDKPYLQNGIFAAIGLVLAILALWQGRRYCKRNRGNAQQHSGSILKPEDDGDGTAKRWKSPDIKRPSQFNNEHASSAMTPPKASAVRDIDTPLSHPQPQKNGGKVTEDDSVLEEAELYAANGRLAKAVEMLQEIVKKRPAKADDWSLLLSLYSSLGKVTEFEKTAREFLKYHKASPLWSGIQALGRSLDHDNPLYVDHSSHILASHLLSETLDLHHPIGDILLEMGVLSKQEIQNYLNEFDPKKHGRFGGYLVARKAITLAQLDLALLQQQGVYAGVKHDSLPSLQEIENFLVNFDPKQHGSVGKFMASRNAVTPDQLSQLLKQQSNYAQAAQKTQAGDPPPFDKASAS